MNVTRVLRHLFTDQSYQRYYSADVWQDKYVNGFDLNAPAEDGRYGALVAVIRRYDRGSILDAGCGDGMLEARYRPLSDSRLVGVDYAPAAIEAARARAIAAAEFHCSDFQTFRPQERYSVIVLNESLYYVEDALGTLRLLARWLDDDGVFVVSMFETLVTRRIWKTLRTRYASLQGVAISDEASGRAWRIRVLGRDST